MPVSIRWGTRAALASAVLALVFAISIVDAGPAHAYSYDRSAAVTYAKRYACNGKACANKSYRYYNGGDCTNFASQALYKGGLPQDRSGNSWQKWYANDGVGNATWNRVRDFAAYNDSTGRTDFIKANLKNRYSPAATGDIIMYDLHGKGWDHLAVVTGWGNYISYPDPKARKNYNQVNGGYGDKIAQHTTDRDGAPWNWAYYSLRDSEARKKVRAVVLHVN